MSSYIFKSAQSKNRADHTPSGKIIKAQLRVMAREEWVRRTKDGKVGEVKSKL